jgi:hypothetical protein
MKSDSIQIRVDREFHGDSLKPVVDTKHNRNVGGETVIITSCHVFWAKWRPLQAYAVSAIIPLDNQL